MNLIQEFQKRASAAGLTDEQIQAFVNANGLAEKQAEAPSTDVFAQLCQAANVEKSAEAVAYAEGFLKQACDRGINPAGAVELTKQALAAVFAKPEEKKAEEKSVNLEQEAYFAGLYEKAASLGFTPEQTKAFLTKAASGGENALQAMSQLGGALGPAGQMVGKGGLDLLQLLKKLGPAPQPPAATLGSTLDKTLSSLSSNPALAGGLAGAGLGGLAGGISGFPGDADPNNPEAGKSHIGRNALLGALAGGGLGAGAGSFAPGMFKQMAA